MNVIIEVHLHSLQNNFTQSGNFPVPVSEFKKDPEWAVAIVAFEWIQQIKRKQVSSEGFRIDKVIYNGEHDITDLVKKVKPIIQDDLPF